MKKCLSLTLNAFILTSGIFAVSARADSLQEIYLQARQHNHAFQAAKADMQAGVEEAKIGRAALLPQIKANASWNESSNTNNILDRDYDTRDQQYGVGLQQNLVNLSVWHQYQGKKALASLAEAQFVKVEQDLIINTANAYFDVLKAVDNFSTAKAEEQALSHQLEQTKQRFEVGLTAITEVHEAQAAFDSSTAQRLIAQGALGVAFEVLEVLTGQSYDSVSPLKNDFPVLPPEPMARKPWEDLALSNNVQIKISELQRDAAGEAAKAAKSGHMPTLTGGITYGNTRHDLYQEPLQDADIDAFGLQLNLEIPLFSGGGVSAARRQAASQALSARELYLQSQRVVVQTTRATHLRVRTAAATVKARKQAITSSRSALEATQAGYDVGTRDLVDVLNAQGNLYVAQRNYYEALYTYIITTLELKQAAGVLVDQDIVELDAWLDSTRSADYHR